MTTEQRITVTAEDGGRLDKVLSGLVADMSRARIQGLIADGMVTVNGKPCDSASSKVKPGDEIVMTVPPPVDAEPEAQDIPLDIVFEDEHMLVIDKPPGLVVHPAPGNPDMTLVNALLAHCGDNLSGIGGVKRPGIVHRLDKETSGLMAVAKSDVAHHGLAGQLADRSLSRVYRTIVWGAPVPPEGTIQTRIGRSPSNRKKMAVVERGGKDAVTHYRTIKTWAGPFSLVECKLQTGRTHQIRVHMMHMKHWIVGDPVYGKQGQKKALKNHSPLSNALKDRVVSFPRQALHAARIEFIHPVSGESMSFESKLPDDMAALVAAFETERS